jgi:tRNA1Val (adenine37-N6)-methyltransferase
MSNNFFQFKQFIVHQDKCAMKVCTDACLFGSVIANKIQESRLENKNCLDIGAGTGLLSLMVAQKNSSVKIDAVEIDENAAQQAEENFQASVWKNQLRLICANIKNFQFNKKYDFIFSNPPFFEDDLKSNQPQRNTALHSADLRLEELLHIIKSNLTDAGIFAVLLSYHRTEYFEKLCSENRFYCNEKILVRQTPQHNYFRSMLFFSKENISFRQKEIIIQTQANQYSEEFKSLLRDYYWTLSH